MDLVWVPEVDDIYPGGQAQVSVDPGALGAELEGRFRPTHFAGVLTVVAKFLAIVRPDAAYFGEKDYQQLTLIRRMVLDLDLGVQVVGVPTVREPDGLALSSRNVYLSPAERADALALSQALRAGQQAGAAGHDPVEAARAVLDAVPDVLLDYLELRGTDLGPAPAHGAGAPARRGARRRHPTHRQHANQRVPINSVPINSVPIDGARLMLPRRLLAPPPGWTADADVVVVGSGIAGLTTALHITRQSSFRVLLVTKDLLAAGSTQWAQGGIAAALGAGDSPDDHLADTLAAGAGLCDPAAVRTLVREGPAAVRELAQLGARFDRGGDGAIALTREGGHHRDRVAHAGGDATGAEIQRALVTRVLDASAIEVIEHALVLDLLLDDEGAACGVTLHVLGEGQRDGVGAVRAGAVVLATGGIGQVYASTTNPSVSTGDGVAAALRAGAVVTDLEFVQFHPTVTYLGPGSKGQQPLVSEAVRGEGAFLVDDSGTPVHGRRARTGRSGAA